MGVEDLVYRIFKLHNWSTVNIKLVAYLHSLINNPVKVSMSGIYLYQDMFTGKR